MQENELLLRAAADDWLSDVYARLEALRNGKSASGQSEQSREVSTEW